MRDPDKPQNIIEAAVRVFARKGYYNSRVSDIAREAGIAAGTIYLYFRTKDDILVTLFRDKMAAENVLVARDFPPTLDWSRISIGLPEEMALCHAALKKIFA